MSAVADLGTRGAKRLERWWFTPLPVGRIAVLRAVIYLFAWYDVFSYSPNVLDRVSDPAAFHRLFIERILPFPTPTHGIASFVQIALPVVATITAFGRWPRFLGWVTFVLYFDWLVMGDSYGYVPHDRFAFLVALAVMPSVGSAKAGDMTRSERAGWALRCIQVAVVATYFLSAWSKVRYGGWHWANGAVLTWAFLRRPTWAGTHLLSHPTILHISQWGAICAETLSPIVLFLRGRWVYVGIGAMAGFHAFNQATLKISFLPHVLCILAFLPIEHLGAWFARARSAVTRQGDQRTEVAGRRLA
jgi:hypothetical protein